MSTFTLSTFPVGGNWRKPTTFGRVLMNSSHVRSDVRCRARRYSAHRLISMSLAWVVIWYHCCLIKQCLLLGEHAWQMRLACCLSPLNSKLSPVRQGNSWMGDHLGIASCWFSKKLGTHVSRVGLSRASRVFLQVLRFSSLRKVNLSSIFAIDNRQTLFTWAPGSEERPTTSCGYRR